MYSTTFSFFPSQTCVFEKTVSHLRGMGLNFEYRFVNRRSSLDGIVWCDVVLRFESIFDFIAFGRFFAMFEYGVL